MRVEIAISNADDFRTLFFQHEPIIGVGRHASQALCRRSSAFFILVGDGQDLDVVQPLPDHVEAVAIGADRIREYCGEEAASRKNKMKYGSQCNNRYKRCGRDSAARVVIPLRHLKFRCPNCHSERSEESLF